MKRIQLEPWTPYDKLSLASAVVRTGDQNWNAVARATRNIFEESTKYMIEDKRPPEWFSNKQCAAQYEALLKNIGPRRKKKTEKSGADHIGDSPTDIIMNAVKQECIEELKRSLAATQALYLKLHKEYEDIQAGKVDHKLEEMLEEYEAKEREKEIKMKLKFKLGEKNPEIMENTVNTKTEDNDIKKIIDKEWPTNEPSKTNLTTSPLLTSLLQSPSPLTRAILPSNTSPTISLLLNSSPSVPTSDSPTLTKLLETSTAVGSTLTSSNVNTMPQIVSKQDIISNNVTVSPVVTTVTTPVTTLASSQAPPPPLPPPPPPPPPPPQIIPELSSPSFVCIKSETDVVSSLNTTVTLASSTVSTAIVSTTPTASTPITTTTTTTTTSSADTTVTSSKENEVVPLTEPTNDENCSQEEEVILKNKITDEEPKPTPPPEDNKELMEIEEVVNPTTPEVVLEDIVHSVVESEVVISQEASTSKKPNESKEDNEEIEETEADEEVIETVEQIIEKVEEAIIETVGEEESAEIDITLNQSSETDNFSDNIETLELDSDAVELIVLGHNQGKVITIRHDTEINNEPIKPSPPVVEASAPVESFGDVENIVEEEVRTSEEKTQEIEETVAENEEIKLQEEEIVEHEEILENKEHEEVIGTNEEKQDNVSDVVASSEGKENYEKSEGLEEEIIKLDDIKREVKIEVENVEKITSTDRVEEIEVSVEDKDEAESIKTKEEDEKELNEKILEEVKEEVVEEEVEEEEEHLDVIEEKVEEAVVEEAPEEVVIAELVEEVVDSDKVQDDNLNNGLETSTIEEETVKQEIITDDQEISSTEEITVETKSLTSKDFSAETMKSMTPIVIKEEEFSIEDEINALPVTSIQKENISQRLSADTIASPRNALKESGEHQTTSILSEEVGIKIEEQENDKPKIVESRPNQEPEKRRIGRKRYHPATGSADSKPNSPAPSSHSMEDDREYKAWKKSIMLVYNRLAAHKYASVFLKPITEAEATGYHNVVLRPMDLTTIKRNIETGVIRSTVEFQRDMILMAQNAMIYNRADSVVFKMAEDMLADMMSQMEVMVQALGDGVPLWGDSDEKLLTRGRASKVQFDESGLQKRRSHIDDTPRGRRQQSEESVRKRRTQDESFYRKKFEDSRKKVLYEDNSKRKSLDDSSSKRKSHSEETSSKRKGQYEEIISKKKVHIESDSGSSKKKIHIDDSYSSVKKKFSTDDTIIKKLHSDDSSITGKRKLHQNEDHQSKRKSDVSSSSKRKSYTDENSFSKRKSLPSEEISSSKRKPTGDDISFIKRKRSSVGLSDEPRSANKRKRSDVT